MSADLLREAAEALRVDVSANFGSGSIDLPECKFRLAVADWLEAKAEQDDKGTCDDPRGCCNLCEHDYGHVAALAVARVYLGRDA